MWLSVLVCLNYDINEEFPYNGVNKPVANVVILFGLSKCVF